MRPNSPRRGRQGFTLIELMIVVVIIGILASFAMANYSSMREKAEFGACISNQRHIHEASVLYAADHVPGTQIINVQLLTADGLLQQDVGECPSSGTVDFDDYSVEFTNNNATAITCSIEGAAHQYTP